jgi:serine/threonine-protein kinase
MPQYPSGNVEKLTAFLDENLDHFAWSLDAICKKIGISRAQLHRTVKEKTQLSITLFIRQKRLEKAKILLFETDLRISEIAYLVGIESPPNFSKYFIEAFQISPTEFRKQRVTTEGKPVLEEPNEALSIAVLPFLNMSNDAEQEYFSDGITEEIINALTHVPALKVAGRTSCFTFKGKNQDIRFIGQQLNVTHVLDGSVRKSGTRIRITAQLVKVEDGYQLWSERYDRELKDIFDIQDEISLAILKEIKVKLFGEEQPTALKRFTPNPDAYQLYLHGRFYHNKFGGAEEFKKAISYFEAAIALEPDYAIAYSGIASCYLNLWFYRHLPPEKSLPQMKQATEQALRLDSQITESYLALARMQLLYEWDFDSAAHTFKKAMALNQTTAELHGQYALFLSLSDKHDKAREHVLTALSLDPFSLINNFYASYIYWLAEDFDKAIVQGRRLVELEPAFWGGHLIIGLNLITFKNYPEALKELEKAFSLNYSGLTLSACGVLFGLSGEVNKAKDIIEKMAAVNRTQPVDNYDLGIVYACIDDIDTACIYFEKAIEAHEPPMLFFKYIVRDWLKNFQNNPRYHRLLQKIKK